MHLRSGSSPGVWGVIRAMKKVQRRKANPSAVLPPQGIFTKKGLRAFAPSPLLIVPSDEGFKLPGQDLNLEWQDQNLLCYRLHHRAVGDLSNPSGLPACQSRHHLTCSRPGFQEEFQRDFRRGCQRDRMPSVVSHQFRGKMTAGTPEDACLPG